VLVAWPEYWTGVHPGSCANPFARAVSPGPGL
jgi:hypothetical protein